MRWLLALCLGPKRGSHVALRYGEPDWSGLKKAPQNRLLRGHAGKPSRVF